MHTQHSCGTAPAASAAPPLCCVRAGLEPRPLRVWSSRRPGHRGAHVAAPRAQVAGAFTLRQRMLNRAEHSVLRSVRGDGADLAVLEKNLRAVSPAPPAPTGEGP